LNAKRAILAIIPRFIFFFFYFSLVLESFGSHPARPSAAAAAKVFDSFKIAAGTIVLTAGVCLS
jgi:hypothetical protein